MRAFNTTYLAYLPISELRDKWKWGMLVFVKNLFQSYLSEDLSDSRGREGCG